MINQPGQYELQWLIGDRPELEPEAIYVGVVGEVIMNGDVLTAIKGAINKIKNECGVIGNAGTTLIRGKDVVKYGEHLITLVKGETAATIKGEWTQYSNGATLVISFKSKSAWQISCHIYFDRGAEFNPDIASNKWVFQDE